MSDRPWHNRPEPEPREPLGPIPVRTGPHNGFAIAALVTTLVGLFLTPCGVGVLVAAVGAGLGLHALSEIRHQPNVRGRGMAVFAVGVGGLIAAIGAVVIGITGLGSLINGLG